MFCCLSLCRICIKKKPCMCWSVWGLLLELLDCHYFSLSYYIIFGFYDQITNIYHFNS